MYFREELFALQDVSYGDFQAKLTPGIPRELFIGVRVPEVRKLAKRLVKEPEATDFKTEYLDIPGSVHSDEYYVQMMCAWFFATALAKQWNETVKYIEEHRLDTWIHNKTIQKACESRRITPEQKEYLMTLKR